MIVLEKYDKNNSLHAKELNAVNTEKKVTYMIKDIALDKIVGYINASKQMNDYCSLYIFIKEEYRNKGYAKLALYVMERLVSDSTTLVARPYFSNKAASKILKKAGFEYDEEMVLENQKEGMDDLSCYTKKIKIKK